jgi:serine protease inhibitor
VVNQQTPAQRQFAQTVQRCLGTQVKQCSFTRNPQQCRQQINRLISSRTNQKLQTTVPPQAVTENTKMVAVSALQLNAKWSQQFRQQQTTTQARFYPLGCQQSKRVQVIQSQGQFNYYEDGQVRVVGIPTQQRELTMYIILPTEKDGLTQVEKQQIQNGQQLRQLLDNCDQQTQYLQVQLPKFQAKHQLDAKRTLLRQGVQDAFDSDAADFSGITGVQQQQQQQGDQIHLNKLIQQATIKVTEQGISSANTGSQGSTQDQYENQQQTSNQDQDEYETHQENQYEGTQQNQYEGTQQNQYGQQSNQVKVNHAFAFVIKHNPSNQIIAVGRIVDPTQKPHTQQQQGQYQGQNGGITDQE